jgi:hypothetical protein
VPKEAAVETRETDRNARRLARLAALTEHPERDFPLLLRVLEPIVDVVQRSEIAANLGRVVVSDRGLCASERLTE